MSELAEFRSETRLSFRLAERATKVQKVHGIDVAVAVRIAPGMFQAWR